MYVQLFGSTKKKKKNREHKLIFFLKKKKILLAKMSKKSSFQTLSQLEINFANNGKYTTQRGNTAGSTK